MKKISILLPLKENFSEEYPGAVSLFINDTSKISKYKKNIQVFGNTTFKKKFNLKYKNLNVKKYIIISQNRNYVSEFIKSEKKNNSELIEVHNRPKYINYISNEFKNKKLILYFHNDPLSMNGSKNINERIYLLRKCVKIIFNSNWSKKRFLVGLIHINYKDDKLIVIKQSAEKRKINLNKKKKIITFVGRLNKSKGYDLFGKAVIRILNKYPEWSAFIAGDEPRDEIKFKHKNFNILGFVKHKDVLKLYDKTSIAVIPSRWEEPFGRSSLEATASGCATIISDKGGLTETTNDAIILKSLNINNIVKSIDDLILKPKKRFSLQKKTYKNFYLTHKFISKKIDNLRDSILINKRINILKKKPLRIIHVTNFNERFDGRLYFNTGKRINNGFIRLGHSVLEFSDRDILKHYRGYTDPSGSRILNEKLKKTCSNFNPDLIVFGHADLITEKNLLEIKDDYKGIKFSQWFIDPLNKNGPDYEKNKKRILNLIKVTECNFLTTSPDVISFLPKNMNNYFIPNPTDSSLDTLNNFDNHCDNDVFFALSHGVHRGTLRSNNPDNREIFIKKLINKCKDIKFDIYGIDNIQPIWADNYLNIIKNSKMGLNLSRGSPIKYYSSDRIAQIIGNGLVALIDHKTCYNDFFTNKEAVFYRNMSDLIEKINRISKDDKLRREIAKNGKKKYMKYFNSNEVAEFIINKSLDINAKKKYLWHD